MPNSPNDHEESGQERNFLERDLFAQRNYLRSLSNSTRPEQIADTLARIDEITAELSRITLQENIMKSQLPLSSNDRKRLSEELNRLPAWAEGDKIGKKSVLRAAGLSDNWIQGMTFSGVPKIDTPNVIANLEIQGHLSDRPTYHALGALIEYLLNDTPFLESRTFLAYLLDHYEMITDLEYQKRLREKYALLEIPTENDNVDLGWKTEPMASSWQGPSDPAQLEKIWSKRTSFLDATFLEKGARVARSVCRIENRNGAPLGTGFIIATNLVLTNAHVVPTDELVGQTQVRFGYKLDETGKLEQGRVCLVEQTLRRSSMEELDFVVLQIEGSPISDSGANYLTLVAKNLVVGSPAYIIQHPYGDPQKVVLQDNWITYIADDWRRVQYLTNTEYGSSGSPVFDENWDVVALHHSRAPIPASPKTKNIRGNEGIPMKAILPEIQDILPQH